MKLQRLLARHAGACCLSAFLAASAFAAAAPDYPVKPLRVIVPFPPGGGTDFVMRAIAPQLSEQLGQQVLIDNRAGAQGVVGTQIGARAINDGYTLTIVDAATVISALGDKIETLLTPLLALDGATLRARRRDKFLEMGRSGAL